MGTVFLAQDAAEKFVAIKVIRSDLAADPEFRARFRDEVAAARRVAPFCTAQVLDADPDARRPYLVTEYIDGVRLDQAVTESGPLPLSTLQGVAVGVASALTAIHRAGIVHRDLKPSNVMLSYSGPRVIDFGIARTLDMTKGRTQTGLVLGSVGWMAPEQMEGAALGPAVDVFAWGLLIGYAATGGHPYGHGTYLEMSEKILTGQPDLRAMPPDLTPIVRSALARDPRDRPSTENLLLTLLGERGRAGDARDAATALLDGTWPRGRSTAGAGAAALAGGAGAGWPDPTHVATPYEQRRWWENEPRPLGGDRWWNDSARDRPPPAGPPVPPPALAPPPAADRAAGPRHGVPRARRRRRGGFVQYDDEADGNGHRSGFDNSGEGGHPPPAPDARPRHGGQPRVDSPHAGQPYPDQAHAGRPYAGRPYAGQPYAGRAAEAAPSPQAPARPRPVAQQRPPSAPAGPAPAPAPRVAEARPAPRGRAPAPYAESVPRPRPRRRFRLRIPFKRTILFVLVVLLLLSAADQIALMVDEQRQRLWNKVVTSVKDDTHDQLDSLWNRVRDTFGGSSGGSSNG